MPAFESIGSVSRAYVRQRPDRLTLRVLLCLDGLLEVYMYIGGGLLGLVLLIVLIVYLMR
jgi:hypothetical protein